MVAMITGEIKPETGVHVNYQMKYRSEPRRGLEALPCANISSAQYCTVPMIRLPFGPWIDLEFNQSGRRCHQERRRSNGMLATSMAGRRTASGPPTIRVIFVIAAT
jgi:hypothetical protein